MLNIQLARKYGTAIFEIANEDNKLEEYGRELADVSQALFAQAELKDFLTNPQIQPEDKKQVLLRLLKDQVSPMMMNFLLLLVDKRRIVLLEAINDCYQELSNKAQGIIVADVTTAYELKAELRSRLSSKLKSENDKNLKLSTHQKQRLVTPVLTAVLSDACRLSRLN